jgi:hypothetical protein
MQVVCRTLAPLSGAIKEKNSGLFDLADASSISYRSYGGTIAEAKPFSGFP